MRAGRIVALVIGCLLVLPALALLIGGGSLAIAYAVARDDDGYITARLDRIESDTVAVTAEDITFGSEPGDPDWVLDWLDLDVRVEATPVRSDQQLFLGIARQADLDEYLAGTAHDEITDIHGRTPEYRNRTGDDSIGPPVDQGFWTESTSGVGTQELVWAATGGDWSAVLMNADGSPSIAADVDVGVKSGWVLPLALILLGTGVVLTAGAVTLIVVGARGMRGPGRPLPPPTAPGVVAPPPVEAPEGASRGTPVALGAELDADLSRWQWLVKWFLAIPHFIVLIFLYIAFFVLTVVAGFAILFTGRYPRGIFEFNVGVLRWTWRVSYYATSGGLGTDRYPHFSLEAEPDDLATLDIEYPEQLSRGLVLVKWWLLAIPHYLVLAVITGSWGWTYVDDAGPAFIASGGLLGLLVLIAAVMLLFTDRYPRSLFVLVVGLNRWIYRVIAYAALMTDEYPPFRLDQGGAEPGVMPSPPPVSGNGATRARDELAAGDRVGSGPS